MLIKERHLQGILQGKITLAFRKWNRPTVKAGGQLTTKAGVLAIDAVDVVTARSITEEEARQSGFPSKAALLAELAKHAGEKLYRIRLRYAGEDPRIALRENSEVSDQETAAILKKLQNIDARSMYGPWTKKVMGHIDRYPQTKAGDMAEEMNMDKEWLKVNIRKLKALGLTESLHPGYRLSPRGEVLLAAFKRLG